ncbi:MAG: DNA polymerase III, partial [Candidatus Omnitrophica bacterium]|nr:DNA polymerase III [Candidatus Omnitrophota bacterium]
SREGYDVDIDRVIEYAARTKTILELNAYYDRLDLNDTNLLKAREKNVMIAIGTDAHNIRMMEYMKLGVSMARRGWLEKHRIINCYPVREMLLKRKRV